jgi:malate permease and related proteins
MKAYFICLCLCYFIRMIQFSLIIFCLILGQICRYYPKFPKETAKVINAFVLYISLPAVIILKIPELIMNLEVSFNLIIPISMAWLMFIFSYLIFYTLGKRMHWSSGKTAALILTAGLANTSFVGFPLLEALRGPDSIRFALIADQLGTFLTFSTLGLLVANIYATGNRETYNEKKQTSLVLNNILNIFKFPPFIILMTTAILSFFQIYPPQSVNQIVTPLAKTLGPLALFAVGFGLNINGELGRKYGKALILGIGYKLFISPLIFIFIFRVIFSSHTEMTTITILESSMASMITASVVCNEFDLEPDLANLMVGLSIPLSLISVPLWNMVLSP